MKRVDVKGLLDRNRRWAAGIKESRPDFFKKLAGQQSPQYLWIGCSDSRVPANEIVDLMPGEVFVHRNVGNLVVHSDMNCLTVLQYAVDVLKVRHVIVCGHYGCGGVAASIEEEKHGLIDNWLRYIRDIYAANRPELDRCAGREAMMDRLCEMTVMRQVYNLCETTIVQDAWSRRQGLSIHGWVYGIKDGLIRDLRVSVSGKAGYEKMMKKRLKSSRIQPRSATKG